MTNGPLPPHERSWRHPSEIPPPPHEPPTRVGRLLIGSSAVVSLLLVGLMALRMTPGRSAPGVLVAGTVSTTIALAEASADSLGELAAAAARPVRELAELAELFDRAVVAATSPVVEQRATAAQTTTGAPSSGPPRTAMVTPIGPRGLGITTASAVTPTGVFAAMLPSGAIVPAEVVGLDGSFVIVSFDETASDEAVDLAAASGPARDDLTVVVAGSAFRVGADDLDELTVPEASPIFDSSGALVGLCANGPLGCEMLVVTSYPVAPVSAPPTTIATTIATTVAGGQLPGPVVLIDPVDEPVEPTDPDTGHLATTTSTASPVDGSTTTTAAPTAAADTATAVPGTSSSVPSTTTASSTSTEALLPGAAAIG